MPDDDARRKGNKGGNREHYISAECRAPRNRCLLLTGPKRGTEASEKKRVAAKWPVKIVGVVARTPFA